MTNVIRYILNISVGVAIGLGTHVLLEAGQIIPLLIFHAAFWTFVIMGKWTELLDKIIPWAEDK